MAILGMERGHRGAMQNGVVLENVSYGQLQALSAVPPDCLDGGDGSSSSYVITPPVIMEGRGVVKRYGGNSVHHVPMHADWFLPNSVNRLERQVVPHYFSGKSPDHTPEKYMECRNRVVGKFMENPTCRLSVADCQGLSPGVDSDDMTRIVRFLDNWGIINYTAPDLDIGSQKEGFCLSEDFNGELTVPVTALKSIDSLIRFDKPKRSLKSSNVHQDLECHNGDDESDLDMKIRERLCENQCYCCSKSLPLVYYQSQKEVDVLLCTNCFCDGKFVVGHSSLDFVKFDSMKDFRDYDGDNWSDQETLLLLEGMELYNENWHEISDHVGSKSRAQCILHFLRMPIDDASLENIDVPNSSNLVKTNNFGRSHLNRNGNAAGDIDTDSELRVPFANSGNPVMSLVAFLASAVGPRVAAACAHECLSILSDTGNGSDSGNRMNVDGECASQPKEENLRNNQVDTEAIINTPVSAENVRTAAKAGLAAAATKAKLFADHEEREIQRLSANIINHQLKRLELKLKQFAEVETLLMKECEQVERLRQRIAAERALILSPSPSQQFGGPAGSPAGGGLARPTTVLPGANGAPAVMLNNAAAANINNRPQVLPGSSSSQPFVSGNHWGQYGTQQKMPMGSLTR
jgi:SWI/SNF related-matrix-associated actin-dependent regulator of chromatin subfamily C